MSATEPYFSVILPVHGERSHASAVQSVVDQTFPDWELLLVNAVQSARFREELDGLPRAVRDDPRVRIPEDCRGNIASAVNHGFRAIRGRWVIGLDSFDRWTPDCLSSFAEFIARRPEAGFVFGDMDHRIDGRFVAGGRSDPSRPLALADCFARGAPPASTSCYRRDLAERDGGFADGILICGNDFFLRLSRDTPFHPLGKVTCVRESVAEVAWDGGDRRAAFAMVHERFAEQLNPGELPSELVARRVADLYLSAGRQYLRSLEPDRAARVLRRSSALRPSSTALLLLRLAEAARRVPAWVLSALPGSRRRSRSA